VPPRSSVNSTHRRRDRDDVDEPASSQHRRAPVRSQPNIDAAARDVQAAINARRSQLPQNLPKQSSYRKVNPADAHHILALTSDIMPVGRLYDAADSILAQSSPSRRVGRSS